MIVKRVFLSRGNPGEVYQSTYKQFHSTETVPNDLHRSFDFDVGAIFVLFDGLKCHLYADDTQLYILLKPSGKLFELYALKYLENCGLQRIIYYIKCNGDKTESFVITKKRSKEQCVIKHNPIAYNIFTSSNKVRNLGSIFNSIMDPQEFINIKCKSAFYNL